MEHETAALSECSNSHELVTPAYPIPIYTKLEYDSSNAMTAKLLQYVEHETASQDERFTSRHVGFASKILSVQDSIASLKSAARQSEPTTKLFPVSTDCPPMQLSDAATSALAAAMSSWQSAARLAEGAATRLLRCSASAPRPVDRPSSIRGGWLDARNVADEHPTSAGPSPRPRALSVVTWPRVTAEARRPGDLE